MMTCKQLIDSLAEHIEGRSSLSQKAAVTLHLLCCTHCRAYLHNYKLTINASRKAFENLDFDESSADIPEDLVQAILSDRRTS